MVWGRRRLVQAGECRRLIRLVEWLACVVDGPLRGYWATITLFLVKSHHFLVVTRDLLTNPCVTLVVIAEWGRGSPLRDNLAICCSICCDNVCSIMPNSRTVIELANCLPVYMLTSWNNDPPPSSNGNKPTPFPLGVQPLAANRKGSYINTTFWLI